MSMDKDQVAKAINNLATHVECLGVGDAATTMGALEYLATEIHAGHEAIAEALYGLTAAAGEIATALGELADATKDINTQLDNISDSLIDVGIYFKSKSD